MRIKDRTAWADQLNNVLTIGHQQMLTTNDDMARIRVVRDLMIALKPVARRDRVFLKAVGYEGNPREFSPNDLPWAQVSDLESVIWRRWEACLDVIVRQGLGPTTQFRERI